MKKLFISLVFALSFSAMVQSQESNKPELLPEPANWEFEKFALPPAFAPGIYYKGIEELRFAPGMFNKDSVAYFTYAFVAQLDSVTAISQNEIKDYLEKYYKGLCAITARDRKLTIDTAAVTVAIENKKGVSKGETIYNATLNIFGVFTDGAPLKLNMEVTVFANKPEKRTYLLFITSPQDKTKSIWKKLYAIQKGANFYN